MAESAKNLVDALMRVPVEKKKVSMKQKNIHILFNMRPNSRIETYPTGRNDNRIVPAIPIEVSQEQKPAIILFLFSRVVLSI